MVGGLKGKSRFFSESAGLLVLGLALFLSACTPEIVGNRSATKTAKSRGPASIPTPTPTPRPVATRLQFVSAPPAEAVAGVELSQTPEVAILDQYQNLMDTTALIGLGLYSDSDCTLPILETPNHSNSNSGLIGQIAFQGLAQLPTVIINRAGTVYLQASAPGLENACSPPIEVHAGAVSVFQSQFIVSDSSVVAGNSVVLRLVAKDDFGNLEPSGISASSGTPGDSALTFSASDDDGAGSFDGELIDHGFGVFTRNFKVIKTGIITFHALIGSSQVDGAPQITVHAGMPYRLAFTTNPGNGEAGAFLSQQPEVQILDAQDNLVQDSALEVTISIGSNPASGVLFGTTTIVAVNGVAQFSNLSMDTVGENYTLIAQSSDLIQAESSSFKIKPSSAGPAARLGFNIQPDGPQAVGMSLSPQPQVVALNAAGSSVAPTHATVTLSVYSDSACQNAISTTPNGRGSLSGTLSLNMEVGFANFSGISINQAGPVYLKASAPGLSSACTNLISVTPGAVSEAESTLTADKTLLVADGVDQATVTITLKDDFGNPISGVPTSAGTSSSHATLWAVDPTTNENGEAIFGMRSTYEEVTEVYGGPDTEGNLPGSLKISFFSPSPPQGSAVPFLLPTTGIETLKNLPIQAITPHDANSGTTYTFALVGSLPDGLSFNSTTGSVTGTPTQAGRATVKICVVSPSGFLTYQCQPLRISVVEETQIVDLPGIDAGACPASAGIGTSSDPIVIHSIVELDHCVRAYPNRAFRLDTDLDFDAHQINALPEFSGVFDGGNHLLRNWDANDEGPLFRSLVNGAVIKNLKLNHFGVNQGSGILTNKMAGAMVHHLSVEDSVIRGGVTLGIVTGAVLWPTNASGYHGSIDHVTLSSVRVISNTIRGWAHSGLVAGYIAHSPFRISNVRVSGSTALSGGNALGVIVGSEDCVDGLSSLRNQGNIWFDSIAVGSGVVVNGGAFASGIVGIGTEGDAITNSYSLARVTSGDIGGSGIVGTVKDDETKGSPELIANTYFAGTLIGDGLLVGTNYRSGKSIAVHTIVLKTLSQPLDGSGNMVSYSNATFSDDQFKDSSNAWFDLWKSQASPPWVFSLGSYPDLEFP